MTESDAPWHTFTLPERVETRRLVLRPYAPGDGPALKQAIDDNLDHLKAWMPWAAAEPSPLEAIEERVGAFAANFEAGPDWPYAIFVRGETAIAGSTGIHARIGPNALEIGYWIDRRLTRRGYATEAAAAMTATAFGAPAVERVEIRCDPRNAASAAIPRRLGYRHVATLEKNTTTPVGDPRDTMVWELTRRAFVERQLEFAHYLTTPSTPTPAATARELLRHTVATLAYRGGKALRGAPADFGTARLSPGSRAAGEFD